MFSHSVIRQAGMPVLKTSEGMAAANIARRGAKYSAVWGLFLPITIMKYISVATLERAVANAAPKASRPAGSITNMNNGSRAMFSTPPMAIPVLDWRERPSERIRWASSVFMEVTTPPATTVQSRYSTAWRCT